ncbi:MAG TPA: ATP synthase subunit I [Thermodesulfobacteriota bacterium]|nr:ATP synthase subunit I [Thermodesulfobacteriota bacterium]
MTLRAMKLTRTPTLSRIEKEGLIVTAILVAANALLGSRELAVGVGIGGALVLLNFVAINLVVNVLVGNAGSTGFNIFVLIIKLATLIGIVAALFIFAKINIYGFLIGMMGVVIVIVGESLRGNRDGAL